MELALYITFFVLVLVEAVEHILEVLCWLNIKGDRSCNHGARGNGDCRQRKGAQRNGETLELDLLIVNFLEDFIFPNAGTENQNEHRDSNDVPPFIPVEVLTFAMVGDKIVCQYFKFVLEQN